MRKRFLLVTLLISPLTVQAAEFHVAVNGNDVNPGTAAAPLRTIQHAADLAQPGDVITVHAGVYRERATRPRGGLSDRQRITYQAVPGEKVTITGSEPIKGWTHVGGDTWKVSIPNSYFGAFNPYADLIRGDFYIPDGRPHHTGDFYLDGVGLTEAPYLNSVHGPAGSTPLWYGVVDGVRIDDYLVNLAWLKPEGGAKVPAAQSAASQGTQAAPCSEGGMCVGFIEVGDWLRYDNVDFGAGADSVELCVASLDQQSSIELRLDNASGELLGTAEVEPNGDWQKWTSIHAAIKRLTGKHTLCVVFKTPPVTTDNTNIWAQFKGVDPNKADVEINVRKTVFTPEKTGINYITLRGFTLRNAATNWAPPSAAQIGLVSAYWCKGWIIEDNDVTCSRCCGIALGKYGDQYDNTNGAGTADPYTECVRRALDHGWNKETVGSHVVRSKSCLLLRAGRHCGQHGLRLQHYHRQ